MPQDRSLLYRIIDAATARLPEPLRDKPWTCSSLNHGINLLHDALSLDCYLAAYGEMHVKKLEHAFGEFFEKISRDLGTPYELFDWGCGQGLASLVFLDFLARYHPRRPYPERLTLVEASDAALERALGFLTTHIANLPEIRLCHRWLPGVQPKADEVDATVVATICPSAVHIFSNVLDVAGIDLKKLATLMALEKARQYVLAVGPCNAGQERIEAFSRYFTLQPADILVEYQNTAFARLPSGHSYGCRIKAYRLDTRGHSLRSYAFYPSAQYCCGYRLDMLEHEDFCQATGLNVPCAFEVLAPYDMAASVCTDPHPLLAVLHNIVCRGLPTKASPFLEEQCRKTFGLTQLHEIYGTLTYQPTTKVPSTVQRDILARTPLAVARVQRVVLQALLTGELQLQPVWKVLALEQDVPCCALALQELADMFRTLAALTEDYASMRFPDIQLIVVSPRYANSPLHLDAKVVSSLDNALRQTVFDLILDVAVAEFSDPEGVTFSGCTVRGHAWFNIRSSRTQYTTRTVLTTERVRYRRLLHKENEDRIVPLPEESSRMRYFLRLLFRKKDFREGQLEILHRALRLESVIGLLPTGGGKSLTYQLAAMLQPGVTLVVDPINSLMKDQFDGLHKLGIDCCSYINYPLDKEEQKKRRNALSLSRYLLFFISPERLAIHTFRQALKDMADANVYFAYGVVDEVHCVSEWGHDFRFSYLHLGRNLYTYVRPKPHGTDTHISLIGLTATASFDVLADVERELSGNRAFPLPPEAVVRHENTNRLELQYRVIKVNDAWCYSKWDIYRQKSRLVTRILQNDLAASLRQLLRPESVTRIKQRFFQRENITDTTRRQAVEQTDLSVAIPNAWYEDNTHAAAAIIFCPHAKGMLGVRDGNKKNSSEKIPGIASNIREALHNAVSTFAGEKKSANGITSEDEDTTNAVAQQEAFIQNKTGIMVATKAFGMGIDKPNIRFTVNINHPGSLEAFVQEAGRAGRDKKMALAIILYSDWKDPRAYGEAARHSVDFDVHKYFYNLNFLGQRVENAVIYYLMTCHIVFRETTDSNANSIPGQAVKGFMQLFEPLAVGETTVFFLPYNTYKDFRQLDEYLRTQGNTRGSNPPGLDQRGYEAALCRAVYRTYKDFRQLDEYLRTQGNTRGSNPPGLDQRGYEAALCRAVYRMCCIGLIDDFTQDYGREMFRVVLVKKPEGFYYKELESFLAKYYNKERATAEAEKAKSRRGNTEIQKCLGFLSDFVYDKIAVKRLRAIQDMEEFCRIATRSTDWLETNEILKDHLYYYFNSKYARETYIAPTGEPYSLTVDTEHGKTSTFATVRKYLRVVDDDMAVESSPRDNIQHLQGAVRLLRRSLTDSNPALDLLNVFCLLYLNPASDTNFPHDELEHSFIEGYMEFLRRSSDTALFYDNMARFRQELGSAGQNIADTTIDELLDTWSLAAEAYLHAEKSRSIITQFLRT